MEETGRLDKVKNHFKRNWKIWAGMGAAVVVGGLVGYGVAKSRVPSVTFSTGDVSDGGIVAGTAVIQMPKRRIHPGYAIQADTGEVFASQNQAADAFGIDRRNMSKHLNGVGNPDLNGRTFTRIGEAAA